MFVIFTKVSIFTMKSFLFILQEIKGLRKKEKSEYIFIF